MQKTLTQLKAFWAGRTGSQRIVLGAGGLLVAALIAFFAHMIAAPDYKTLMTGLDPADAQTLSAALTAKNIPNQLGPDGKSISVPADKMDAARLDAASADAPHSGRMGFEIFDKVSWGQTEFDEKVNYQRALEGELERTIMTIGAVKSARVHLVMATDSIFLDQARNAKASVALKLRGGSLSRDEVQAMQRLVAGAVDGLKPADVAIIDADTGELLGSPDGEGTAGGDEAGRRLTQQILATLAPVVGADHVRASVNVEYDPGTTDESQEKYDPSVSVPLTVQRSDEESGTGAGASGVPGTASNVPQGKKGIPAALAQTPGSGPDSSKTENSTFGVNHTIIRSVEPAGRIRRITAALLVDDAAFQKQLPKGKVQEVRLKRSPEELKQLSDLAEAAIGFDSARGDVLTIEDMSFERPAAAAMEKPSLVSTVQRQIAGFATPLRYLSLLVLFALAYFFTIRPMQKHVLRTQAALGPGASALAALPELQQAQLGEPADQTTRSTVLKDQLTQLVKSEPAASARAVQAWMHGEGAQ